jgi:hypothetical protein
MEARRGSRPVATVIAYRLLTMDAGLAGAHSATPRARGPPSPLHRADASSPRMDTHARGHKKGEAMRQHHLSVLRTREASPSYS